MAQPRPPQGELVTLVAVGDTSPKRDDPESMFALCGDLFRQADIAFAQLETPISDLEPQEPPFLPHAPARSPARNVRAYTAAGIHIVSFAGNHALDGGYQVFFDTMRLMREAGIQVVGAGRDLHEARQPAILERKGVKVAFLACCSILPLGFDAAEDRPGVAPLFASTHYEQLDPQPGTPPRTVTRCDPQDLEALCQGIAQARGKADVVVVSFHFGVHYVPAVIADYQKEAAYAAIDAGADLILGHHAHILKGIEVCKSRVIFYGLGNFAMEHHLFRTRRPMYRYFISWRRLYPDYFPSEPEPGWERYPFHSDARKTVAVRALLSREGVQQVSYLPAMIRPTCQPEPVSRDNPEAQAVFDYVEGISRSQGLKATFAWDGNEVVIGP